jgi:hypothetical protein
MIAIAIGVQKKHVSEAWSEKNNRGFLTSPMAVVPLDAEDLGMCHGIEGEICVLFIVTLFC